MRWLIGLAGLLAIGAASAPRTIAPATFVKWKAENGPRTFRSGDVTVRAAVSGKTGDSPPVFTISAPGIAPIRISNDDAIAHYASTIAIGPLVRGQPASVIVQTYSGGAHCCMHVAVALREGKTFKLVDLGDWDGDGLTWPTDITGDGVADFQFVDNSFLYAFGSYAGSYPPPLIINIRDARPIDVSHEAAFRPLFEKDLVGARKACLAKDEPNAGACAAWAADAARLGQFDAVWPQVMKVYDNRVAEWPGSCKESPPPTPCYTDYPTALRAFLIDRGYLRR
jgi:hypothetical protein